MRNTFRRLAVFVAVALMAAAISPAASAKAKEVDLLTGKTAAVTAGAGAWVALNWTADEDISNFKVVVTDAPDGVAIEYPANLGSWTGLSGGHFLDADEIDYTALKVVIPASYSKKDAKIKLEVSYDFDGKKQSGKFDFKVPVVQFTGDVDISQTSSSATVGPASGWVGVSFAGHAPSSNGFTMVVTDPAGLAVTYPSYGSSTSLDGDNVLQAGETDIARFHVDPTSAVPGDYPVGIEVSYDAGDGPKTLRGTVTITIEP